MRHATALPRPHRAGRGVGVHRALFLVAVLLLPLSGGCSILDPIPAGALRVLFVGNSLTYTNDLPAMVAAFAEAQGRALVYETVALPNYSLEDHWLRGDARETLAAGRWDFVVMQQGPSSLPENQTHLREWAARWADEARAHGAEPALYVVWPSDDRLAAFPAVIASYTQAAEAAGAALFPAGPAWLTAWERDASLPLYGPDGFHPSVTGTYLSALVVYGGLTDASLEGLPSDLELPGGRVSIPADRARLLQDAAADVLAERRRTGR